MENKDMPAFANDISHIESGASNIEESFKINKGLTKREYFAGLAMQGYLSNSIILPTHKKLLETAEKSAAMADALLKALDNKEVCDE